jgi:hypothetical protein
MPPEARAHHYVPQCWLAGFTESGQKDGKLWQTDLDAQRQWPTNPLNAGHQRDYYRLSDPRKDPLAVEKKLSEIEGTIDFGGDYKMLRTVLIAKPEVLLTWS